MRTLYLVLAGLAVPCFGIAQNMNFVRIWEASYPTTSAATLISNTNAREVRQTTTYYDGIGRDVQEVLKQGSPLLKDLVSTKTYNAQGLEEYQYLPFVSNVVSSGDVANDGKFKGNSVQQQVAFYNSYLPNQGESNFYTHNQYEQSPLNRPIGIYAPGKNWAGTEGQSAEANRHNQEMRYAANNINDNVQKWTVTDGPIGTFGTYSSVSYPNGELFKTIKEDEHGGQVLEIKDKEDHLILRKVLLTQNRDMGYGSNGHDGWLNTYYVYDRLGRLRCVVPPNAERAMWIVGSPKQITDTNALNQLCFRYEYDARNRMIMKQVPGGGVTEMVYDTRDRLIMSRDSSLKAQGYWLINKYDNFNRIVQTGLNSNASDRATHQSAADANINYPTLDPAGLLQQNYYDDYAWASSQSSVPTTIFTGYFVSAYFLSTNISPDYAQPQNVDYANVKGKPTGSKIRVLGTSTYLYSIIFYDDKGRMLQTHESLLAGGTGMTTYQYDFNGKPLRKLYVLNKWPPNSKFIRELTKYSYDHGGRTLTVTKKIGYSGADKLIVTNTYDELGRLKTKNLGTGLETQTYEYNVRGWLLGVNRSSLAAGTQPTSKFAYELAYDKMTTTVNASGTYGTPSYRGDIAGMSWRSIGDWENRKYNFTYDAASRLLKADFTQFNNSTNIFDLSGSMDYSVVMGDGIHPDSAYDVNGNILRMTQKGFKINTSTSLDDMRYTYLPRSNKIAKVTDAVNDPNSKLGDFKDGSNGVTDDYTYDANGNLYSDKNKNITSILYTHQNQPYEINISGKGKITYAYDNLGRKLKKVVTDNTVVPAKTTTWLYIDNYVFKNDTLQFFSTEEGRARYDTTETGAEMSKFDYDYFIKDHLGNVRMVLTDEKDTAAYSPLTFEDANISAQNAIWENKTGASINVTAARTARPSAFGTSGTNGSYTMLVKKSTGAIGAAKLLKVMSGDRIHAQVEYFYTTANANNTGANGINSLLANLATSMIASGQVTAALKDGATALTSGLSGNATFVNWLNTPNATSGTNNAPKAYLNILFFDEQFRPDNVATVVVPVDYSPNTKGTINRTMANAIQARQNGYVYIYFSNETEEMVYFDNFIVTHELGSLREETHYYPFGLTMAAISSRAIGKLDNKRGFNGNELQNREFSDGSGLELYDFNARSYDQQIGRFIQIDPMIEFDQESLTPYHFSYNNPIRYNDPDGKQGEDCCGILTDLWDNGVKGAQAVGHYIQEGIKQAGENFKDRWEARADPIHQALDNPFSIITGPISLETKAVQTVSTEVKAIVSTEAKVAAQEVKATAQEVKAADYSGLKDGKSVGPGKDFTASQKSKLIEANKQQNGGVIKSDKSGTTLNPGKQAQKGQKADMNQAEVDHVVPKSKGGSNSFGNAQILSKDENLKKGNR